MGKFTLDLTKIVNKTKLRIDTVVQKATFDIFKSVIMMSPVDIGTFKGNWRASQGGYSSVTVDTVDKSGTTTVNAMAAVVFNSKAGGIVYMVNNLPYARILEYGRSDGRPGSAQAPNGMVRTTIIGYQQFIKNSVGS